MAEADVNKSSQRWTNIQAYVTAVICLLVGCAVGYLVRGSVAKPSTPAPVTAGAPPGGAPGMGGGSIPQPQMPSPEQLKSMADKQAEPLLQKLKSNPKDPALLAELGNLYFDAQDFPAAIDYYQKSLRSEPKNVTVRSDMAIAIFSLHDVDVAISEFDRALKYEPKNANALFNRGVVKWQGKMDVKGAVADWELLLRENPKYEQADKVRTFIAQAQKHANLKPGQKPAM